MKFQKSYKFIGLCLSAAVALVALSCQKQVSEGVKAQSPTEAYQMLFSAIKAKDSERIKQMMSKNTISLAEAQAQRQNQELNKTIENALLGSTFSETMPEIRDERVKDEFGAVEVYNQRDSRWEDTFFINEDGGWKLAIGDVFRGTYKSPGKSRMAKENELSNSSVNTPMMTVPNANVNISPNKNANVVTTQVTPEIKQKK